MKQALYIAGPECFYRNGTAQLEAMRREAEACGYDVTLPNDTPLDLGHEDLRRNADAIFRNCADSMDRSTAILCDLAFYRGPEPDGGSIYELGMAYARGISCYGYTRDKRAMCWKYQGSTLRDGQLFDRKNRPLPYASLPFSPNVVGAVKIVEGGFSDCLALFRVDEEETRKHGSAVPVPPPEEVHEKPILYLAGPQRWDASPDYREAADVGRACGFEVIRLWTTGSPMRRTRTRTVGPTGRCCETPVMCAGAMCCWQICGISTAGSRKATPRSSAAWPFNGASGCTAGCRTPAPCANGSRTSGRSRRGGMPAAAMWRTSITR